MLVVVVLDCGVCLAGKPLPPVSQEGCCVAVVFCLYSPSTSKMSGAGTLCARVAISCSLSSSA